MSKECIHFFGPLCILRCTVSKIYIYKKKTLYISYFIEHDEDDEPHD